MSQMTFTKIPVFIDCNFQCIYRELGFLEIVCLQKRMHYKIPNSGQDIHPGGREIVCPQSVNFSNPLCLNLISQYL